MKEFDEIPFVPCNDCTSWESCTQDAYEQGKADAKAEYDKECDTCILTGWKEKAEEIKRQAREEAIDECIKLYDEMRPYLATKVYEFGNKLRELKEQKE